MARQSVVLISKSAWYCLHLDVAFRNVLAHAGRWNPKRLAQATIQAAVQKGGPFRRRLISFDLINMSFQATKNLLRNNAATTSIS